MSIMSDKDFIFISRFWRRLHNTLGSKFAFGIAFHPQTDSQSKRMIQILEDMLKAYVINFKES